MNSINKNEISELALEIRDILKKKNDFEINPICTGLPPVSPFVGGPDIKYVVIGQDPTIRNVERRKMVTTTLNLNKGGALRTYLSQIVDIEHVYATNIFKYFYKIPPADTFNVLENHLAKNLELLKFELSHFKNLPVILLGEPVLRLLSNKDAKVRGFWGYDKKTGRSTKEFKKVFLKDNLGIAYSFPHQPSIKKKLYAENLEDFISFFKAPLE